MDLITLTIHGAEYVAIPRADYEKMRAGEKPDGADWARAELGRTMRRARETAGLSQVQLAKKMRKSQTLISRAEAGELAITERFAAAVLKACGLPANWPAAAQGRAKRGRAA